MHGHIGITSLSYLITCIELSYFFDPSRIKLSTNQVSEFLEKLEKENRSQKKLSDKQER